MYVAYEERLTLNHFIYELPLKYKLVSNKTEEKIRWHIRPYIHKKSRKLQSRFCKNIRLRQFSLPTLCDNIAKTINVKPKGPASAKHFSKCQVLNIRMNASMNQMLESMRTPAHKTVAY